MVITYWLMITYGDSCLTVVIMENQLNMSKVMSVEHIQSHGAAIKNQVKELQRRTHVYSHESEH